MLPNSGGSFSWCAASARGCEQGYWAQSGIGPHQHLPRCPHLNPERGCLALLQGQLHLQDGVREAGYLRASDRQLRVSVPAAHQARAWTLVRVLFDHHQIGVQRDADRSVVRDLGHNQRQIRSVDVCSSVAGCCAVLGPHSPTHAASDRLDNCNHRWDLRWLNECSNQRSRRQVTIFGLALHAAEIRAFKPIKLTKM